MILLKDMISISPKIKQDVLSLPARERIDLVDRFITSLNVPTDPDVDSCWGDIAETRLLSFSEILWPLPGARNQELSLIPAILNSPHAKKFLTFAIKIRRFLSLRLHLRSACRIPL